MLVRARNPLVPLGRTLVRRSQSTGAMQSFRNVALLLASAFAFALAPACVSDNTSSTAQMIECTDTGSGTTNCHPVSSDTGAAGTCVDLDEDDDGTAHDADDDDGDDSAFGGGDLDDDDDGVGDADDDDDDNDGIDDDRDCDERHGGDDDDSSDV